MLTLTAHHAKNGFGDALRYAQQAPVQITRNGKPVAVIMSIEDYQMTKEFKMKTLKERIARAEEEIKQGKFVEGREYMRNLIDGMKE